MKYKQYKHSREGLAELFFAYKDKCEFIKDLLAQKEDKKECICNPFTKTIICPIHGIKSKPTPSPEKECKHKWKLTPDTWGETCFYCGKQRKIKTTHSPLEIEKIKEISLPYSDAEITINKLIRNQKLIIKQLKQK